MLPPARILIVEDEEILADNLKMFLGRRSPDVRIAHDAETAMEMLKSFTPDLVVLDFALPGIDGLRAYANFVRVRLQKPSCVMITGYPTALMAESASRQGIRHLLCKPFSFAELQHAVEMSSEASLGDPGGETFPEPLANVRFEEIQFG
jgi:DNA-binding response OmpR family regulator